MERQEEAAGSKIAVKRAAKSKGKSSGRQTKLPMSGQNNLKHTKPSPFAEAIEPNIPEFNAVPKKPSVVRQKKQKPTGEKGTGTGEKGGTPEESEESGRKSAKQQPSKKEKIATAKAIAESFDLSGDEEVMDDMDLGSRLALNKPTRTKTAPVSYADMDASGDDDESLKSGPLPSDPLPAAEEAESDHISIPDSDSSDDFVSAPKRPKVVKKASVVKKQTAPTKPGIKKVTSSQAKGQSTLKLVSSTQQSKARKRGLDESEEEEEGEDIPPSKRVAPTVSKGKVPKVSETDVCGQETTQSIIQYSYSLKL